MNNTILLQFLSIVFVYLYQEMEEELNARSMISTYNARCLLASLILKHKCNYLEIVKIYCGFTSARFCI